MNRARVALLLILALAAAVRFWGLYHRVDTDENKLVSPSVGLLNLPPEEAWYPRGARYPHAAYYTNALVLMALRSGTRGGGWDETFVARTITVVESVLMVGLLYLIGVRLGGRALGLLAALFLAVLPLQVKYAHYAHVDMPAALAMLATVWAALRLWEDGRARWYLLTGLLAGASAATQYYGILIVFALILAHLRRVATSVRRFRSFLRPAFFGGLFGVVVGAFLMSPYSFFRWEEARRAYEGLALRAAGGDLGHTSPHLFWPLFTKSPDWGLSFTVSGFVWEVTFPLFVVAVAGGAIAVWRRDGRVAVLIGLLAVLFYVVMASYVRMHAVKRLLPLTPLVSLLAAYGLWVLGSTGGRMRQILRPAATLAVVAIVGTALWIIGGFDSAYAGGNTHKEAVRWATEHLPPGSRVLQPGPLAFLPGEASERLGVGMREEYANFGRNDTRVRDDRSRSLVEWIDAEHIGFVVIDSRMADRYYEPTSVLLFPEMTASYRSFYDEVRRRGSLIYAIEPRRWRSAGPAVEIFDVRNLRAP